MTHQREYQEEWLTAYLDGELDEEQLRIVRKRLEDDPAAGRTFEELKEVRRMIGTLQRWSGSDLKFTIDPAMAPRLEEPKPEVPEVAPVIEVTEARRGLGQRSRPSRPWRRWTTIFATAACLLIAAGFFWTRFNDLSSGYLSLNTSNRAVESRKADFATEHLAAPQSIAPPSEPLVETQTAFAANNNELPAQAESADLARSFAAGQEANNVLIQQAPSDPSRLLQRAQNPAPPQPQVSRKSMLRFNTESESQATKKIDDLPKTNEIALSDGKSTAVAADISVGASSLDATVQTQPGMPPLPALASAAPSPAPASAVAEKAGMSASGSAERAGMSMPGIAAAGPTPKMSGVRQERALAEIKENTDKVDVGAKLHLGVEKETLQLSLSVDYPVEVDVIRSRAWPEADVASTFQQVIRYLAVGELETINNATKPVAIEYLLALVTVDASSPAHAAKLEKRISQKQLLRISATKAGKNVADKQNTPVSMFATILFTNREQADTILAELGTSGEKSAPLTPLWIVPSGDSGRAAGAMAPVVLVLRKP